MVDPSKQANIHTHMRNAVTLVWGLLRLAPINIGGDYIIINVGGSPCYYIPEGVEW